VVLLGGGCSLKPADRSLVETVFLVHPAARNDVCASAGIEGFEVIS
jgi:hypothetical protein